MDFSLSSSLVGSAVSNPDKLALDLQFATDKTLTARKGPTPVFTRSSTGRFVGSNGLIQAAAINTPRFDHDPVTGVCKGLLIEESRTNLSTYSGALVNNVGWLLAQATSVVSGTGPDGNNAYEIADDTTPANVHGVLNSGGTTGTAATSVVSGTIYTGSIFLKKVAGNIDWVQVTFGAGGFGVAQYANFNIANGTVGNSSGLASGTSPRIEAFKNGWYRCSISVQATTTTTSFSTAIYSTNNTNPTSRALSYNGNPANKFLASLCQFEAGSFPTSYIPTTTASVIRSADVCSISGSAFSGFWDQTSGTMLEVFEASPNTNTTYVSASNGNITQNSIHFDNDTGNMRAVYYSGSSIVATLSLGSVGTVGAVNKIASAYSVNDFSASRNGGTVVVDSSGVVPASLSQINIGTDERSQMPVSFYSNRCIGSLRYYQKRLSDAKLQTLTV